MSTLYSIPISAAVENGPYELNSKGEVVERELAWDVTSSELFPSGGKGVVTHNHILQKYILVKL